MLLADEVTRRDRQAATLRAARAGLDPTIVEAQLADDLGAGGVHRGRASRAAGVAAAVTASRRSTGSSGRIVP